MGQNLRAGLFGVGFAIAAILVIEALGWAQTSATGKGKVVAQVNGEAIHLETVDAILAQNAPSITPPTTARLRQQRIDVLTILIDDILVKQFLRQQGPKIDPSEVDRQYAALEAAQKSQGKTLAAHLKEINQTEAQVKDNFRMMLQLAKYIQESTTEEGLRKYYESNKDFFDKVTVRTRHIVLRIPSDAPMEERQKAKQQLAHFRNEITQGKMDFAQVAKDHSQCSSAPKGGDIGYVCRKFQVDEAYAKAAFALKPNEISDVVETEVGYHLIQLIDRKAGVTSKYLDVAVDVRDCYESEMRQLLLAQLRKRAKVEITLP